MAGEWSIAGPLRAESARSPESFLSGQFPTIHSFLRLPVFTGAMGLALLGAETPAFADPFVERKVQLAAVAATTEEPTREAQPAKPSRIPPELQRNFDEYMRLRRETQTRFWQSAMQKELDAIVEATGLPGESKNTLEKAANEATNRAVESAMKDQEMAWTELLSGPMPQHQKFQIIAASSMQLGTMLAVEMGGDAARPEQDKVWLATIQRVLTPDQAAAWKKVITARTDAKEKEIQQIAHDSTERNRELLGFQVQALTAEIKTGLNLNAERSKTLDELGKRAVDAAVETLRKKAVEALRQMSDETRRQYAQSEEPFESGSEDSPSELAVWKDGLAKLLTDDERQRLEIVREENRARRDRVFGEMFLAELDRKVAFTAAQREQLLPIAARLVKGAPGLSPEEATDASSDYSLAAFHAAAGKVSPADREQLNRILDATQWSRWQALAVEGEKRFKAEQGEDGGTAAPEKKKSTDLSALEPEEFENAISDFMLGKAAARRKHLLEPLTLEAEDIARVTGAAPEALARLKTAARGSVEGMLGLWKFQMESNVRSTLRVSNPLAARRGLSNLEDINLNQRTEKDEKALSIWNKTVQSVLTAEQLAAWKKEVAARAEHREKSIAGVILIEIEAKTQITREQWAKLELKLLQLMRDYAPELASQYNDEEEDQAWYLQAESRFVICAGIPKEEMQAILAKDQWERWAKGQELSDAVEAWNELRESRAERVKNEKAGATRGKP